MKKEKCLFCRNSENLNGEILFENGHCRFIELNNKTLIGSGLIVTKKHKRTVFDISLIEWISIYCLLKKVKKYINDKYNPDGYNLGWNVGLIGGQEVFHVHMHIIPRFKDEPYAGRGIRYWLKQDNNARKNT